MSPRNPSARRLVGFSAASPMGLNDSGRQNVSDQFWCPVGVSLDSAAIVAATLWGQRRGGG
jgi:hypothetical protein